MYNCILHTKACDVNTVNDFVDGMNKLIEISTEKSPEDVFYKNSDFWSIGISGEFFSNFGQNVIVITKFVESCKNTSNSILDDASAKSSFPNDANCFLGIEFANITGILNGITCLSDFRKYKNSQLWNVDCNSFWEKKDLLFDKLIFCDNVKSQIESIADNKHFEQVLNKLKLFNQAIKETWDSGNFSYKIIKRDYPLTISPESDGTINKYGNERTFQLPDGNSQLFDLHIKMGDKRIHFFPDNDKKIIYIGYIGEHLPIASEN